MAISNQTILDKLNSSEVYFAEELSNKANNKKLGLIGDSCSDNKLNNIFNVIVALRYRVDREIYDDTTICLYNKLQRDIPFDFYDSVLDPNYNDPGTIIIPDNTSIYRTFISLLDTPNTYINSSNNLVYVNSGETGLEFLSLESKALVSPVISPSWTLFNNDGVTLYNPATSSNKNIIVDLGVIANLDATYLYPVPGSNQTIPISVSGDFGTSLPVVNTPSNPLIKTNITSSETDTVILAKPKSGLIVVNNQVMFPTGNDTTSDSISITFSGRSYIGYSTNTSLGPTDILALSNKIFANSKVRTTSGITANPGFYTYIVYNAAFGNLANVIMDNAEPILGAFTKLADVSIVNDAGFTVLMRVYKSNATQAFTNNTLTLS